MEHTRGAYSQNGRIVDQRRMQDVRYGVCTSDVSGCGWIAAYNFLKCMNVDVTEQEAAAALSRHALFRGRMGTSPFRLRRWLVKMGFPLKTVCGKKKTAERAACAKAGIILYRHSGGWHYVAFEREREQLHFYNAVSGAENHVEDMRAFLTRHNLARVVFMIYLPQPERADG